MNRTLRTAALIALFAAVAQAQQVNVDPALPSYQKVSGISFRKPP